jgi:hypothetical protein
VKRYTNAQHPSLPAKCRHTLRYDVIPARCSSCLIAAGMVAAPVRAATSTDVDVITATPAFARAIGSRYSRRTTNHHEHN